MPASAASPGTQTSLSGNVNSPLVDGESRNVVAPASPGPIILSRALIAYVLNALLIALALIVCIWARVILIPLVLAIFLTFMLAPIISAIERRGLGRIPSLLIVFTSLILVFGGLMYVAAGQFSQLFEDLPTFSNNIREKIQSFRTASRLSAFDQIEKVWVTVTAGLQEAEATRTSKPAGEEPVEVIVKNDDSPMAIAGMILPPVLEVFGQFALATILSIFILLDRENLRNRIIWLISGREVTLTTKAIDETTSRISRFLLMQALVNGIYGIGLALTLWLVGVKFALLFGILAATLRYIPFLGAWIAAIFPTMVAFAQFPDWWHVGVVVGAIVVLELVTNNVLEPILYGKSMGVSAVGFIVAATFWTFLWGGIGLLLAGPLTVCIAVAAKYVRRLSYLYVLLSDEVELDSRSVFYQRLMARDVDEALAIAKTYAAEHSRLELIDHMITPAIVQLQKDRDLGLLTPHDEQIMLGHVWELYEELTTEVPVAIEEPSPGRTLLRILAVPTNTLSEIIPLQLLARPDWDLQTAPRPAISSDLLERIADGKPQIVCLCSLKSNNSAQLRYLARRIHSRFPEVKILLWHTDPKSAAREELMRQGQLVATTLEEVIREIEAWQPVLTVSKAVAQPERVPA